MYITVKIGDKEVGAFCSAVTPIIYRQVFKRDFIREKALIGKRLTARAKHIKKLNTIKDEIVSQFEEGKEITADDFAEIKEEKIDELVKAVDSTLTEDDYTAIIDQEELGIMLLFVMIKQEEIKDLAQLVRLSNTDYMSFLNDYSYNDLKRAGYQALIAWDHDAKSNVERKN